MQEGDSWCIRAQWLSRKADALEERMTMTRTRKLFSAGLVAIVACEVAFVVTVGRRQPIPPTAHRQVEPKVATGLPANELAAGPRTETTALTLPSPVVNPDSSSQPSQPAVPKIQVRDPPPQPPEPPAEPLLMYNGYALRDPVAREALAFVGRDENAEAYWYAAINDPSLSPNERQDLIEDLNEDGLSDPKNPTAEDLPLIANRILVLEEVAWYAMDEVNAAAFQEAYKDLVNLGSLVVGGGEPVQ